MNVMTFASSGVMVLWMIGLSVRYYIDKIMPSVTRAFNRLIV